MSSSNLFNGMKFYLSIYTPNRTKIDIVNNGGTVVASEDRADLRIVNPSRPIPSRNAGRFYSYELIRECIKQNRLVDEGPYLIETTAVPANQSQQQQGDIIYAPARPLALSQRRTRNEFTHEDDRILIDWIRKAAAKEAGNKRGFADRGNKVYKDLEKEHPHHSFHSWRNRWLKTLSLTTSIPVSRKHLEEIRGRENQQSGQRSQAQSEQDSVDMFVAQDEEPDQPRQPTRQSAQRPSQRSSQQVAQEEPEEAQAEAQIDQTDGAQAEEAPAINDIEDSSGRPDELFFMHYIDHVILAKSYSIWKQEKRKSSAAPKPTADFFEALHQKYPDVSVNELRRRYYRLRKLYTEGAAATTTAAGADANEGAETAAEEDGAEQPADDDANDEAGNENENEDSFDYDAIVSGVSETDGDQEQFQNCLDQYNDYLQVYVPPSFLVGGRYVETYLLWTATQEATNEDDRIDWDAVVDSLGFDSSTHAQLVSQLSKWYDLNLKEFNSFMKDFARAAAAAQAEEEEEDDDDEEEGEEGEEEETEEAGAEAEVETEAAPTGTPSTSTKTPGSARRSTGFLGGMFRNFLGGGGEPSASASTAPSQPPPDSPSKHVRFSGQQLEEEEDENEDEMEDEEMEDAGGEYEDNEEESDDEEAFEPRRVTRSRSAAQETPRKTPRKAAGKTPTKGKAKPLEPETQDFAFDPESQAPTDLGGEGSDEDEEDEDDGNNWGRRGTAKATPARQLRSEERIISNVPQSVPGSAKRKRAAPTSSAAATPAKRQQRKSMA